MGGEGNGDESRPLHHPASDVVFRPSKAKRPVSTARPSGHDVVDDVLRIPSHTSQQRRAQGVEEEKPDQVQTGTRFDDAPIVKGIAVVGR
jgi:hypothetical protein